MSLSFPSMRGFTLVEMLTVMVIVTLLISIALPTYTSYMTSTRRSDATTTLLDLANRMERYYTANNTYVGATLTLLGVPATTPSGYYTLALSNLAATTYTLQATPIGTQLTNDTQCGALTYNQLGTKGISGSGTAAACW